MIHLVVAYDVIDDRRRNRLARKLQGYLERVQKSVFEGKLTSKRHEVMKRVITRVIDQGEDTVRIYRLCPRCQVATEIIGTGTPVEDPDQDVFF